MSLAMPNIKTILTKIRDNDWYITAFPFAFNGNEYVVVFEDLREIDRGTKYFAVCLTFIDINDEDHRLETYVNAYRFNKSDEELIEFIGIVAQGRRNGNIIWQLYNALNDATPDEYRPIEERHRLILRNGEANKGENIFWMRTENVSRERMGNIYLML